MPFLDTRVFYIQMPSLYIDNIINTQMVGLEILQSDKYLSINIYTTWRHGQGGFGKLQSTKQLAGTNYNRALLVENILKRWGRHAKYFTKCTNENPSSNLEELFLETLKQTRE